MKKSVLVLLVLFSVNSIFTTVLSKGKTANLKQENCLLEERNDLTISQIIIQDGIDKYKGETDCLNGSTLPMDAEVTVTTTGNQSTIEITTSQGTTTFSGLNISSGSGVVMHTGSGVVHAIVRNGKIHFFYEGSCGTMCFTGKKV